MHADYLILGKQILIDVNDGFSATFFFWFIVNLYRGVYLNNFVHSITIYLFLSLPHFSERLCNVCNSFSSDNCFMNSRIENLAALTILNTL